MPQRDRQKQALTRLQRRVDWLTQKVDQDNVSETALSGDGGGDGTVSEVLDGIAQTVEGVPPPDQALIDFVAPSDFEVATVVLDTDNAPSADFAINVVRVQESDRTVVDSQQIVLPSGSNRATADVGMSVSSGDILKLRTDPQSGTWTDTLSRLRLNAEVG